MTLTWVVEAPPLWDEDKARLVAGAPEGIFDRRFRDMKVGDLLPGAWWRVRDGERTVGFGWLDVVWGDAEILLVTGQVDRRKGVGEFILEHLAVEAQKRGLNYLYNTVRPTHPDQDGVTAWLKKHGFRESEDGSLLRKSTPS